MGKIYKNLSGGKTTLTLKEFFGQRAPTADEIADFAIELIEAGGDQIVTGAMSADEALNAIENI